MTRRATKHEFDALPTRRRSTVGIPWVVCQHCGLVALKNETTRLAVRAACPGLLDDPQPKGVKP